ncbi:hypothetical protein FNV43_RR24024 [Rhamnella rubrinervis]|uniref:WRKY domain-containing protein n=1 Tax=Rhamnella rubrinervis TaxID=2594499 RepID=A0A8K0DXB4_9ROSA|nr:hypothetical protein FNV43_RR24024 [Rhamnella rubrinervis]
MDLAAADPLNVSVAGAVEDDPLSCLASLKFEDENDDRFSFPNLVESRTNAFQELQQFYKPFFSNPTTTTTTTTSTSSRGIIPDSFISECGGRSSGQQQVQYHVQQQQHHHHRDLVPANTTTNRPRFSPESYISGFGGFLEEQDVAKHSLQPKQEQKNQAHQPQEEARGNQQGFQRPAETSSGTTSLPIVQSQTPRSRKRKNQQKRMVCHVTAENLSGDLWAWRKYGQKPIKGSPYPRNYYRCSSSKGCVARKQVERSNSDPNMFIVTYTGDHTHPRPTHRNSLAGSSRSKFTTTQKPTTDKDSNNSDRSPTMANPSCSSPLSSTSLSPTTPLTVQTQDDDASTTAKLQEDQNLLSGGDDKESEEMEMYGNEHEDDDILIPNMSMSEDIFLGLQELGCGSPATGAAVDHQSPSSSDNLSDKVPTSLGSYWASSSSAATGAAVGGGF